MLTGQRINAGVVTHSHGIFLTYKGEKCIQYYIIISSEPYLGVWSLNAKKKSLTLGDGHQCKVQISLHSGPMLKSGCHIFNKPQASPLPQVTPFSTPHTHTCDTILLREDDISISDVFFILYRSGNRLHDVFTTCVELITLLMPNSKNQISRKFKNSSNFISKESICHKKIFARSCRSFYRGSHLQNGLPVTSYLTTRDTLWEKCRSLRKKKGVRQQEN